MDRVIEQNTTALRPLLAGLGIRIPAKDLAVAALIFLLAALAPILPLGSYGIFLLNLSIVYAIVAIGLNITNGYLGLLNLAVGGQLALGCYACAIGVLYGMPTAAAILMAIVVGLLASAAIFTTFSRLEGFFFGLATLAAAEIIRLLIRNLEAVTNGVRGLRGYGRLAATPEAEYWMLLAILAVVMLIVAAVLYSPIGVQWRAIRENRNKAASLGVPVRRLQFLGYVMSGGIMSLGGALLALLLQYIEPSIAGLNTLVQTVLMVALGGAGTIAGPVLGAVAITIVPEMLRVTNELRLIIYGVTLMVIVLAIPAGVVGSIHRFRRARQLRAVSLRERDRDHDRPEPNHCAFRW